MFVGNIMLDSLLYQNSLSLQSFRCIALFTLSRSIAQILFHMVCIMVEQGFHGDGSVFLEWQKNNGKILTEFSKKSHDFSIRLIFNLLTDQRSAGYKFRFPVLPPFLSGGTANAKYQIQLNITFIILYRTSSEPQTKVQTQTWLNFNRTLTELQLNLNQTSTEPQLNLNQTLTETWPNLDRA